MIRDLAQLAFKSLSKRRLRSWLTMLGIFIGIAAVVSLIGLGEGLRTAITSQFGFLGTDVLSVQAAGVGFAGPPGAGAVNPLKDDLAEKISKISGVEASFNRHIETGNVEFNDRQELGFLLSLPSGENRKVLERMVNLKTSSGRLLKDDDRRRILIGYEYSTDVPFGRAIAVGDRLLIEEKEFEVIGIIEKKGTFIFDAGMYMNEDDMFEIFGDDGTADVVAIKVINTNEVAAVQEKVEKLIRKERNVDEGEEDFTVESPQKTLETLNSTLFAVQLFVYLIAGMSIVVGGIGIMNTMYTAVLERTKEIGVMKSIGARNSMIFTLFFIESGFLGLVGGIIGITIGFLMAHGFAFLGETALGSDLIQVTISPLLLIGALIFSFGLGTFFGVLPAIQAAKLNPVEALRSK